MSEEIKKAKKSDLHKVDPRVLVEEKGFNVRRDLGDIEGLKRSIIANGVQEPLLVRTSTEDEGKLVVRTGHRRLGAIRKALEEGHDIGYVPVRKLPAHFNKEDELFAMYIENDGKNFTLLEEGEFFKKLSKMNYDPKEIAERVGKTQPHIFNCLKIASAPKELKDHVAEGRIASTTLLKVLRSESDEERQIELVENAIREKEEKNTDTTPDTSEDNASEEKSEEKSGSEGKKASSKDASPKKGKKSSKVTQKDILGENNPIKILKSVEKEVKGVEFDHTKTGLLKELLKAFKEGKGKDEIVELFKKEDKRTTMESNKEEESVADHSDGNPVQ